MKRWEDQTFKLFVDGTAVWSRRQTITAWCNEEHAEAGAFFYIIVDGKREYVLGPHQALDGSAPWMGAIGPYGQTGTSDDEFPPIPLQAELEIGGERVGEVVLRGGFGGSYEMDFIVFDGLGAPPPQILTAPSSTLPEQSHEILDAIDRVRKYAEHVEDAAETEAEKACARTVREGLSVLETFARTGSQRSVARAAFEGLRTWASRLRSLAGYVKLIELGTRLSTMLDELDEFF